MSGLSEAASEDELLILAPQKTLMPNPAMFALGEEKDGLIGSLMTSAMYGALFHQPFAVQLGQWNLVDWPLALQPVLAASYYDRAEEEAIKQNFDEKAAMVTELGLGTDNLPATLRIMVCGAQSGQRAMELASYLDDVEVIAVDESLAGFFAETLSSSIEQVPLPLAIPAVTRLCNWSILCRRS